MARCYARIENWVKESPKSRRGYVALQTVNPADGTMWDVFVDFAKLVLDRAETPALFAPTAYYDPDGDCIEFVAKPDSFYGKRIDDLLTIYYSHDSGEIVGSLLKGVNAFRRRMSQRFPNFMIEIHDGKVKLEHLFLARLWSSTDDPKGVAVLTYKKLIRVAEETGAETQLCPTS